MTSTYISNGILLSSSSRVHSDFSERMKQNVKIYLKTQTVKKLKKYNDGRAVWDFVSIIIISAGSRWAGGE